jgi:hypothetical protein
MLAQHDQAGQGGEHGVHAHEHPEELGRDPAQGLHVAQQRHRRRQHARRQRLAERGHGEVVEGQPGQANR